MRKPLPEYRPLHEWLAVHAARNPDHPAIVTPDQHITYRELTGMVERTASLFVTFGLQAGEGLAYMVPKTPDFVVAFLAAASIGAFAIPLDYSLPMSKLRGILQELRPAVLLVESRFLTVAEGLSTLANTKILPFDRSSGLIAALTERLKSPRSLLSNAQLSSPDLEDPFYINFSSGTTGASKGALATHGHVWWNTVSACEALSLTQDDVHFCSFPSYLHPHEIFARALLTGGTTLMIDDEDGSREMLEVIGRYKATRLHANPAFYEQLLIFGNQKKLDAVLTAESGGMATTRTLAERFADCFGVPLTPVWGSTETTGVAIGATLTSGNPPPGDGLLGVVRPYYEACLLDESNRPAHLGSVGQLVIRGPAVVSEFTNSDGSRPQVATPDSSFQSGDLAVCDRSGNFYFKGRRDDMVKVSGVKVYLSDIESLLGNHPAVDEVAVIAVDDPARGRAIKVFAVIKLGTILSAREVQSYCREHLGAHQVPRVVEFVARLPRTTGGKILKSELS